ncbi:MAG TPA: TonB-dependent receptor plug domain-containing protein [Opitutus sp.]|nr:TonB-dependent receptor plug domain-containing protein [Opitutus sp.]
MKKTRIPSFCAVLAAVAVAIPVSAQSDTPPADEDTVQLEKLDVNQVPIEQQILPTSRPFNSVFGTDDNIVSVPRNVTIISRQQLSDIDISSVLDFSKLTSSSYTTTNFGAPSNPSIRGQSADLYINGVRGRITSNGNGLPLDFNSVESVNIVKGPATAVQGTSMYVGGFIDLITKRPYFDGFKGSVSATVGSYGRKEWNVDVGGPLSKQVAYRFSYSGVDSNGYWHDYYNKNNAFYGALTFRPSDKYELFVNGSASWYRYTENWGINRVTQDLIDNGMYITGINDNNAPGAPSDPQNSKYVLGGGNHLDIGPTVKLDRHVRLLKPGNHSTGREFNAQAIQTYQADADFKIVNNSFFSYTARNTLSTYYYSEIVDPSWFAESRTELIISKPWGEINTGLDLRYQRTKAYDDYFFEPANVWDLTKDISYVDVYNADDFYGRFVGQPVPGWPGRYATQGTINGDTNDSYATTVGPFFQTTLHLGSMVDVRGGIREDRFHANVIDPLWPSPQPESSVSVWDPSYNASLIVKPTNASSLYFTYNFSKNTSGAVGNGGGITGWDASGLALDKENFLQPSELFEVGSKYALFQNKLFLNFAVYEQTRTAKSTSSTVIQKFSARGFEAEMNYQPNRHLYLTASYSVIDATVTAPFQSDGGIDLLPTEGIDYAHVNQVSGLPKGLINLVASYNLDNGVGISANGQFTSKIDNNYAGTLVIPTQYTINASVWYKYNKQWYFRVDVGNILDAKNWAPPNPVYGNASILALPGTEVGFTAKYSF